VQVVWVVHVGHYIKSHSNGQERPGGVRAGMSRNAPLDVKGKLGGDGEAVEGIGVGRLVNADRFISMPLFAEIWSAHRGRVASALARRDLRRSRTSRSCSQS
jgi:hypothetical protein